MMLDNERIFQVDPHDEVSTTKWLELIKEQQERANNPVGGWKLGSSELPEEASFYPRRIRPLF